MEDGVAAAVRAMMPVKNILRDCIKICGGGTEETVRKGGVGVDADDSDSDDEGGGEAAAPAMASAALPIEEAVEPVEAVSPEVAAETSAEEVAHEGSTSFTAEAEAEAAQEESTSFAAESDDIIVNDREETVSVASMEDAAPHTAADDHHILQINEEEDHDGVTFAEYDSVFDGTESNMKYDPKDAEQLDGELIIYDSPGESLDDYYKSEANDHDLFLSGDLEIEEY